jgi:O-antigen/teichoic acid export membrane protein
MAIEPSEIDANLTTGAMAIGSAEAISTGGISGVPARGLRANATWVLVGNTVLAAARQLIFILIAKLENAEVLGQYRWSVAFCVPTITICSFGIRTLLATDARRDVQFSEYFGFTLVAMAVGLAIVFGMSMLNHADAYTVTLVMLVAIWTAVESISDTFAGLFTRDERMDYLAKASILQAVLICVLLTAGLVVGKDLRWGVVGLLLAALLRLTAYEFPAARKCLQATESEFPDLAGAHSSTIFPKFHWQTGRRLLSMGLWLAIVLYLLALCDAIPCYVIKDQLDDAAVGIFSALLSVTLAANLLVLSICQAMVPRLAVTYFQRQRAAFLGLCSRAILVAVGVGILALLGSLVIGKPVLAILFKPKYADSIGLFNILLLGTIVNSVGNILGTAVTSMRQFKLQILIQGLKVVVTYFGCLIAVRNYGLIGLAWNLVAVSILGITCYGILCLINLRNLEPHSAHS